jgi:predicted  nucleic acid-binding Zn-ribbon protein
MKKLIINLLGLNTLVAEVVRLKKENENLNKALADLNEKVDEIETPDMDNYISEDDINDRIESYLNDNDYVTQSYCDDEIESKVSDAIDDADIDSKIESAIEDLDIEEKVRDLFNDASPAPMSEEDIKKEVAEAVKVTLEKMVKALADQQD